MSESLRDSAINSFNEALELMEKNQNEEALIALEKAEEAARHEEAIDIFLYVQTLKGHLMQIVRAYEEALNIHSFVLKATEELLSKDPDNKLYQSILQMNLDEIITLGNLFYNMGRFLQAKNCYELHLLISQNLFATDPDNASYQSDVAMTLNNLGALLSDMGRIEEAKQRYENALEMRQTLLATDPDNVSYQSYVGTTLNNLGALLSDMGRIEEAKQRYENALEIYETLLATDPDNVSYQSDVAMTLNNLGLLLSNMGRIEEAKKRYEKTLEIFTEPMQYLTIDRKSHSIMKLIELNTEQAKKETNSHRQIKYLEKAYQLCKNNQEFFSKYGLKHEKKLVMEAGFSAYVDYVIKDIREEKDYEKRAEGYEKAIAAIEKLGKIEDDEEVAKITSSTVCYLEGRKLVNEALGSEQPDLELIKQATNQFKDAKETYKKANVCYCIYIGLLKILENVELFEEENGSKAKETINQVIEILPKNIDSGIRVAFEEIAKIFDEKDVKNRKKHLEEFDGKIRAIEYKALENLFGHIQKKLKDYIEEPFSPNLFYNNWKLRITFDAEKIKGKLTVKTANTILFNRALSKEEIKDNEIEIDFLERRYIPGGEDRIIFETLTQKPVIRDIDYSETISKNKKVRIFLHDCCNSVCTAGDLRVAAVQLKYDVYGEDYAVKVLESETYKIKVMAILEAVKGKADIVVFPEFSIPFDYLEDIQEYANETGTIVFAGTHYIKEGNLEKYEKLFASDFGEEDFRKNICPVVIPNSKIIHSEKMFGAKEERDLFFHKGMKQGELNHIFKLRDNLNLGVLVCFEYLNDELRHRLISACDVILVPQTNPNPSRFYDVAKNDLNSPLCAGNKACIMANGIFRIGKIKNGQFEPEKEEIEGGSSGILLTLDKDSYKMPDEGIISHFKDQKEQFILLATINTQFSASRDMQPGNVPIETSFIHIFEEKEIHLITRENITKKSTEEFLALIGSINASTDRSELKNLIEKNSSLIKKYSPLMHENTEDLNNLVFEEIKEKCQCILIPAS
jgi:tetratricopeptide (TPR) repeat protein/predicted amidohydrolase